MARFGKPEIFNTDQAANIDLDNQFSAETRHLYNRRLFAERIHQFRLWPVIR
jgi:hypothetical protein